MGLSITPAQAWYPSRAPTCVVVYRVCLHSQPRDRQPRSVVAHVRPHSRIMHTHNAHVVAHHASTSVVVKLRTWDSMTRTCQPTGILAACASVRVDAQLRTDAQEARPQFLLRIMPAETGEATRRDALRVSPNFAPSTSTNGCRADHGEFQNFHNHGTVRKHPQHHRKR